MKKYPPCYSKEERANYNKFYKMKIYKKKITEHILLPPLNFTPNYPVLILPPLDGDVVYCKKFGCGKILTLQERLFGDVCINCYSKEKLVSKHFKK